MTQLSNSALAAAFAEQSDDIWLIFLTISHEDLTDGPLRLVRNSAAVNRVINSEIKEYQGVMFDITLPAELEREMSSASISVPNVDRKITDALRELIGKKPAVVVIEVSLAADPDTIQFGPFEMDLTEVTWDAAMVTASLNPAPYFAQSWPKYRFDNAQFPGLFPG